MANYIKSDLEFILAQIKIAEDHVTAINGGADARTSLLGLIGNSPTLSFGLRTVDGSLNNLVAGQTHWGSADQEFPRLTNPVYLNDEDGDSIPLGPPGGPVLTNTDYDPAASVDGHVVDADPRIISNLIVDQSANNPAAVEAALSQYEVDGATADAITGQVNDLIAAKITFGVLRDGAAEAGAAVTTATDATAAIQAYLTAIETGFAEVPSRILVQDDQDLLDAAISTADLDVLAAQAVVDTLATNADVDPADTAAAADRLQAATDLATALDGITLALGSPIVEADVIAATGANDLADAGDAGALSGQLDTSTLNLNIANVAALDQINTDLVAAGVEMAGDSLVLTNVAPDEGLSAPFNSWMTLFGQFFDHGLDLVTKDGGTVFMPLEDDDPLIAGADGIFGTGDDLPEQLRFMALSRSEADEPAINLTTPFVDQNQTYASHPSHQVFLREYEFDGSGRPVATGKLITGDNGGMATWADVKAQAATLLGIQLDDYDAVRVPMLEVDIYGNFVPGDNGFPQLVIDELGNTIEGDPAANGGTGVEANLAIGTGHAFLVDIAHNASPFNGQTGAPLTPDADSVANPTTAPLATGEYDNELLDAHFMAGDGRVNENIGLTAVHHVFHSEHNRLLDYSINQVIMPSLVNESGTQAEADADLAFLNEWLRTPVAAGTDLATLDPDTLDWNGERLFQLAKFGTEMQYQHLVFEDFARKVQPQIDVFLAPVGYDTTIDPTIMAEFAHTVYRFGHSMLTETVDRFDEAFNVVGSGWETADAEQVGLIEAFLNPIEFDNNGAIDADAAAAAVVRGMSRQAGNEIDEFVTDALRSNLLGLPLDLAAINLARGRETGVPTLNGAREEFFAVTGDTQLKPYDSWFDLMLNLKNQASVVNFIAAYGTHETILAAETLAEKRDAAMDLVFGGEGTPGDRVAFLNSTGAWSTQETGLNAVDFWIGGLAEAIAPFGGMLGSTFNYVFESQLEALQDGDRFYYLARTASMNFLAELENNSFASMIVDNTDATHLPIDVFATAGYILEVDQTKQYNGELGSDDPFEPSPFDPNENVLVIRENANSLRYTGGEHVVLGGTEGNDTLTGSIGDDAIWGDGGNDVIEGGHGNDNIDGGAGDDIITDIGGDDVIKGNDGNDVIHGGAGLNLIISGRGDDFVVTGEDSSEVFAGPGNDFILGTTTNEAPVGGEGDDWIEGGTQDGAAGDNSDAFGRDNILGHDVFIGRDGFNEFVAEGGDDIMLSTVGITRNEGMSGFDWVSYLGRSSVYADLNLPAFDETPIPPDENTALDRYEAVEGLSGSMGDDTLIGSEETDLGAIDPAEPGIPAGNGQQGSVLTAAGIARIAGLQELLGAGVTEFSTGNIILGGGGSDLIEGRGGNDIIDGDRYLNVRIALEGGAPEDTWTTLEGDLQNRVLSGEINPGDLTIVREILQVDGEGDLDTAVYAGLEADYEVLVGPNEMLTVTDLNLDDGDMGTDTLYNIERLQFDDGEFINSSAPVGAPRIVETVDPAPVGDPITPTEGQLLEVDLTNLLDADNVSTDSAIDPATASFQWQMALNGGTWTDIAGATSSSFTPQDAQAGRTLRVVVTYVDESGDTEMVSSIATQVTGDFYIGTAADQFFQGTDGNDIASAEGGADRLIGRLGDDVLNGGEGNDRLYGGGGDDVMDGGGGNDWFYDVEAGDTVIGGTGLDTMTTALNVFELPADVEDLTFIGTGNFAATGNDLNNKIRGGEGNDVIDGGLGADRMYGFGGDDTYFVDNSSDRVFDGTGMGNDVIFASASFRISGEIELLELVGTADINGTGSNLGEIIEGNEGRNRLLGRGGDDFLFGGLGVDNLKGGNGDDEVRGGEGNDKLRGESGNDILVGGIGNDVMLGGTGSDIFKFVAAEAFGNDQIRDFEDGLDTIDLSEIGLTETAFNAGAVAIQSIAGGASTRVTVLGPDDSEIGRITITGINSSLIDISDFTLAGT